MVKTLQGWIDMYEKKTKDKFAVPNGFRLMYLPERGYTINKIDVENDMVMVYSVCGDGRFWFDMAKLQASQVGINHVCSIVTRHIKPYIKFMGFEILKEWEYQGKLSHAEHRYLCQDELGRKVIFTGRCYDEATKEEDYFVTVYLNEKASLDEDTLKNLDGKEC